MEFSIIAAYNKKRGIGYQGKIPWNVKEDIEYFKKITTVPHINGKNVVIMGANTWNSIPNKFRPLPNRINIIVSKTIKFIDHNIIIASSLEEALAKAPSTNIFVIGGGKIYEEAIKHPLCKKLYLTELDIDVECDVFFPKIPIWFTVKQIQRNKNIDFYEYENVLDKQSQEYNYLNLLKKILYHGESKNDRTGIGTLSIFGEQLRFSLHNDRIPLLTTKKVFWKGIVEELLFFLRGDHDNKKLQSKGVHIWDGNTTRQYLDKVNKKIETDDLGVAYGVQWRAAGAKLGSINDKYKGIDQLQEVIDLLRNDPHSRRIIINAWNVPSLKDMCLPPCHVMYQFYVSNEKYLNCMMTQRSADMFLGLPFNIASVAVLTKIIANVCNLSAGEIIINLGDTHIYKNHVKQVKEQLERSPLIFPKMKINKKLNTVEDIENMRFEDFILENYYSWPVIKADMAV